MSNAATTLRKTQEKSSTLPSRWRLNETPRKECARNVMAREDMAKRMTRVYRTTSLILCSSASQPHVHATSRHTRWYLVSSFLVCRKRLLAELSQQLEEVRTRMNATRVFSYPELGRDSYNKHAVGRTVSGNALNFDWPETTARVIKSANAQLQKKKRRVTTSLL